jgi:hypothetical protein
MNYKRRSFRKHIVGKATKANIHTSLFTLMVAVEAAGARTGMRRRCRRACLGRAGACSVNLPARCVTVM